MDFVCRECARKSLCNALSGVWLEAASEKFIAGAAQLKIRIMCIMLTNKSIYLMHRMTFVENGCRLAQFFCVKAY